MSSKEIDKKLVKAGFSWADKRCSDCIENNYSGCTVCEDHEVSLEELIEACGERFGYLGNIYNVRPDFKKDYKEWYAAQPGEEAKKFDDLTQGFTPKEAVANLYLKIHG